jgi:Tol biopolymer transport system component
LFFTSAYIHAADPEIITFPQPNQHYLAGSSEHPQISEDGRWVVFESHAAFVNEDKNRTMDVYLFDRKAKTMRRILSDDVKRLNGGPSINGAQGVVAFHSYSIKSHKKKHKPEIRIADVYLYNLATRKIKNVTENLGGRPNEGEALNPTLSANGHSLLFTSSDPRLAGQKNPLRQVYLLDRENGAVHLISRSMTGGPGNRLSGDATMSSNGRFVVYRSVATNLSPLIPLESLTPHLYLMDRQMGTQSRIDTDERGFPSNDWIAGAFDMDEGGDVIVFEGRRRLLDDPQAAVEQRNLFVFDQSSGTVRRMTSGIFADVSHNPTISGDGRYVGFVLKETRGDKKQKGGVVVYDRVQSIWKQAVTGSSANPVFSKDGSTLAFESSERDFVPKLLHSRIKKGTVNIFVIQNPFKETQ